MKNFSIHLNADNSPIKLIETSGISGSYEMLNEDKYYCDFIVRGENGEEKVRVDRDHVLYIVTSEVSTI